MIFEFCNVLACLHYSEINNEVKTLSRTVYDYEIDLNLKGGRTVILDGRAYEADANTCLVRRPGQTVVGIGKEIDAYCLTVSFFDDESADFVSRKNIKPIGKILDNIVLDSLPEIFSVSNIIAVKELYEKLASICIWGKDNYEEKKAVAEKLLLLLASEAVNIQSREKPLHTATVFLQNYITENFGRDISLSRLAKSLGFSEEYLIRLFKKDILCTPYEFLIRVRMENARHMLANSKLSVAEIASSCGYPNFSFFSSSFKKRFAMSPSEYRVRYLSDKK